MRSRDGFTRKLLMAGATLFFAPIPSIVLGTYLYFLISPPVPFTHQDAVNELAAITTTMFWVAPLMLVGFFLLCWGLGKAISN